MRNTGFVILLPLWAIGLSVFLGPAFSAILVVTFAFFASAAFFVYYLIHRDVHLEILAKIALGLLVLLVGLIPVVGWLVVMTFVIYNLVRSSQGLIALLPDMIMSLIIYSLLLARVVVGGQATEGAVPALAGLYALVTFLYAFYMRRLPVREALFKVSVMWLAIPLAAITIATIVSSLSSLIRSVTSVVHHPVQVTQSVGAHTRAGVEVNSYTRDVVRMTTTLVTSYSPGAGAVMSSVAPALANLATTEADADLDQAQHEPQLLMPPSEQ